MRLTLTVLYSFPIVGTCLNIHATGLSTTLPFDIDVVFSWVPEPSAEEFASIKTDCRELQGGIQRFRDLGVFRFSLSMIDMYMPWVRHIFVVTPHGATPHWLNADHPQLTVINQEDIFPLDRIHKIMPVHNSQQVEVHLHRIPGLTEHFIYFNDDMFPGRRLEPSFFFSEDGRPAYWAKRESQERLDPDFRTRTEPSHLLGYHVAYPLTISLIRDMQATWPATFDAVESAHCRGDIPVQHGPPWLYMWFGLQSGHMVKRPPGRFSWLHKKIYRRRRLEKWLNRQLTEPSDLVCINDDMAVENVTLFEEQNAKLQSYLEKASCGHISKFEREAKSREEAAGITATGPCAA